MSLPRRTRDTARLIVLDDEHHLLLFRYHDEQGRPWWATPGGGLEAGESFEAAAQREALEELGLAGVTLTPLWCETVEFEARGVLLAQTEQFFLLRVRRAAIDLGEDLGENVRHAHAVEGILAARWWSLDEIAGAVEPVFPERLAERTRSVGFSGPPAVKLHRSAGPAEAGHYVRVIELIPHKRPRRNRSS